MTEQQRQDEDYKNNLLFEMETKQEYVNRIKQINNFINSVKKL